MQKADELIIQRLTTSTPRRFAFDVAARLIKRNLIRCAVERMMRNPYTLSTLRKPIIVGLVGLFFVAGVGLILKTTVDYLLYWDATAAAERWAGYVAENVPDLEDIADGEQPSAESMAFLIRTQQIRNVFGFEIINFYGNVQIISDGSKISSIHGTVHSDAAERAVTLGKPIISVDEGTPPVRPKIYSEAYLPVIVDGHPKAVVAAFVDLSEQRDHFRKAFLLAALALCLLIGGAAGIPSIAWYRRTKEKQVVDRRIRYLAHHDVLTGLANRASLIETLDKALIALPFRGDALAVHFIDLDHFKGINDAFGHDGGDFLLKTFAERLRAVIRLDDVIARLGGDEFVVVQNAVNSRDEAEKFAHRVVAALITPIKFNAYELAATLSVGFALAPADGNSSERLLKSADLALYKAKADGRNCVRSFLPEMDVTLEARIELEKTIRNAVIHDGFVLHYQPIFEILDHRLIGFEALVRLAAEDGTLIPPLVFIPVAEELRLIGKVGNWVLREACRTAATWPRHLAIAVNMSVAQFEVGGVCGIVTAALDEAGLEPHRLQLEVTESLLLGDSEAVLTELRTLKAMGVAIVMDDFGTGYSSLSYLWRFPFDQIKIDRSFMAGLDHSGRNSETVVKTIIALGRALNMRVTIEGVETAKQAAFVRDAEGDQAQGYFFGRPIPAFEIAAAILADFREANFRGTNMESAPAAKTDAKLRLIKT
jgi:diguanylate cyclase (GGDEF)-like protein